jgi:hypothetical protein
MRFDGGSLPLSYPVPRVCGTLVAVSAMHGSSIRVTHTPNVIIQFGRLKSEEVKLTSLSLPSPP